MPLISERNEHGPTAGRIIRRRNYGFGSTAGIVLLCLVVFTVSRVAEGFTSSAPATNGKKSIFESSHHDDVIIRRGRQQQQQQQRTKSSLVLTVSKGIEINGSTINGASSSLFSSSKKSIPKKTISKLSATLSKIGMMAFIFSMCLSLPLALLPPHLLYRFKMISQVKQQNMALANGQFCARWLMRLIPFCSIKCFSNPKEETDPQPSIWVCNHTSALDIFVLLAKDYELRGRRKRPIKIVYWKGLEDNPITKMLFTQCGFIPVEMDANGAGEENKYNMKSFKNLLKLSKKAFEEGFDIGLLPEGQLNPNPEESLLPCFPGAFTLARMSRRPIRFMALHGTHRLWHAREEIGMTVTGRDISLRVYPGEGRKYASGDEFLATFEAVVGKFATTGEDLDDDELNAWLDGSKWEEQTKTAEQGEN